VRWALSGKDTPMLGVYFGREMSKFQLEMNEKLSLKVGLIGLRVGLFGVTKFSEGGNVHCCRRLPGPDRDRDCKFEVCVLGLGLGLAG
jgi:hypothetical protein